MSTTTQSVAEAKLTAVITRADGTQEDMGVIAYYHKNPLKRLLQRLKGKQQINANLRRSSALQAVA